MTEKNIKDVIGNVLSGDAQKRALDFVTYLELNDMPPNCVHGDLWMAGYNDNCVCYIHIDGAAQNPGPWTIWPDGSYASEPEGFAIDEHTKQLALAHVNICGSCGEACSPGTRKTVFGKDFDNVCGATMAFNNPDDEALNCVKKLMEMRKRAI
ncbi:MAG: hypothetical protein FWC76_06265 [Defluviitaleaceae bacterium]|nr:hypothetical protein [Defluviitaleaceae bacterium]